MDLWTFEHPHTPMLGREKSFETEPTQLYQEYRLDITGTVYSVTVIVKESD